MANAEEFTAEGLTALYVSIPEDDINKQTLFNVILTLMYFMIEKDIVINTESVEKFTEVVNSFKNNENTRRIGTDKTTMKISKRIVNMINSFKKQNNDVRSNFIKDKIEKFFKYKIEKRNNVKLPSLNDFASLLNGFDEKSRAAWLESFKEDAVTSQAAAAAPSPSGAAAAASAPLQTGAPQQQPMPSVVETAPFTDLSPDLQEKCRTLKGLNDYIAGLYPGDRDSIKIGIYNEDLKAIVFMCKNPYLAESMNKWESKESRAHLNDCMVEAFLAATCPAFRILSDYHKDIVGDRFRRSFYPAQDEVINYGVRQAQALRNEIMPGGFLSAEHLYILSTIYEVDFLMLESAGLGVGRGGKKGVTSVGLNNSKRVYIIINPDNRHFEAVQPRPDHEDYTITREEARTIEQCINAEAIGEAERARGTERLCEYPIGALVLYKGGQYRILKGSVEYSNAGQPSCEGYLLATEENFAAYNALPNSGRNGMRKENIALILRYAILDNITRSRHTGAIQPKYIPPAELRLPDAAAGHGAASVASLAAAGAPVRMAAESVGRVARAAATQASSPPANNANTVNPLSFPEDRNGYIASMMSMPATQDLQKYMTDPEIIRMYGIDWNKAWGAAGGRRSRRRRRTTKAKRRSLRARRNHSSKGKRHGSHRRR